MSLQYGHNGYDPAEISKLIRWSERARVIIENVAIESDEYAINEQVRADVDCVLQQAKEMGI